VEKASRVASQVQRKVIKVQRAAKAIIMARGRARVAEPPRKEADIITAKGRA